MIEVILRSIPPLPHSQRNQDLRPTRSSLSGFLPAHGVAEPQTHQDRHEEYKEEITALNEKSSPTLLRPWSVDL